MPLPKGFTLDSSAPTPYAAGGPKLPSGFTLDSPAPSQPNSSGGGFIADSLSKAAQNMNVENILKNVTDLGTSVENGDLKNSFHNAMKFVPDPVSIAQDVYGKLKAGDYSGAMGSLIPVVFAAEGLSGGKVSGAAGDAVDSANAMAGSGGKGVVNAAQTVGNGIQAIAGHPVVKAVAPFLAKAAINNIPGGGLLRTGLDAYELAQNVKKASTEISTKTEIPSKISVDSASDAMGTKPNVQVTSSIGKGTRTSEGLDATTQKNLANAAMDDTLTSLTGVQKTQLTTAIKNADSGTINKIINNARTAQGAGVDVSTLNKVAVIAKYIQDHGVDIDKIKDPADRQALADAAVAHGAKFPELTLPKAGKYRNISDQTMDYVRQALSH